MRKKALLGLLAAVTISTNVYGNSYIAEDMVNVRTAPGTENKIMAQLPYGTEVEVLQWDVCEGWALVNTQHGAGYVYNALIWNENRAAEMQNIANSHASCTNRLIIVDTCGYPQTYVFIGSSYEWTIERIFDCSVGKPEAPTPTGTFIMQNKRSVIYSGDTWEYAVSDFAYDENGEAWAFHSTLYAAGTYDLVDDRLGMHISNGCIRLRLEDSRWIWENCQVGTKVVII